MNTSLASVTALPLPKRARSGTRIHCANEQGECFDALTLIVSWAAFWSMDARIRRTSNVIKAVRLQLDIADIEDGRAPDPMNYQVARRFVERALNAENSPLTILPSRLSA